MEGGVDLQEVGLGLQEIPPDGQSAGTCRTVREEPDSPSVLRVRREFLRVFHSLHFVSGFLVHEVHGRSVLVSNGPCQGRRSTGPSWTVCY
jgi:hypothetical protein